MTLRAPQRVPVARDAERAVRHPGRREAADLHPPDRGVEPVAVLGDARGARSSARRAARPSCGPTMPRQPSTRVLLPAHRDPAGEARGGRRREQLRARQRRAVHPARPGRWKSGSSPPSRRDVPADRPRSSRRRRRRRSRAEPTRSQSPPPAAGPGTVSFAARGPSGPNSVNQSEPVGAAPGPLVDRVADPRRRAAPTDGRA